MMFGEPLPFDFPELDKLEEKVIKLINIVQKLHSENAELKHLNEELLQTKKEQQDTINALREQCSKVQNIEDSTLVYKKREEIVRKKIQQMLQKLEAFQTD